MNRKSEVALKVSSCKIPRALGRVRLRSGPGATICAALVLWLSAIEAEAHSVYIFAFSENSQICTNSYFGAKNKVRGGRVSMVTASGDILAAAQTDEHGNACFAPPESIQDLIFKVEAGEGHRAEFKLPASDIESGGSFESNKEPVEHGEAAGPAYSPACAGGLTSYDLRQALSPIIRKLAEMESAQNSRVTLRDIIGGLGWIIGLAGAGLWGSSRKNTEKP